MSLCALPLLIALLLGSTAHRDRIDDGTIAIVLRAALRDVGVLELVALVRERYTQPFDGPALGDGATVLATIRVERATFETSLLGKSPQASDLGNGSIGTVGSLMQPIGSGHGAGYGGSYGRTRSYFRRPTVQVRVLPPDIPFDDSIVRRAVRRSGSRLTYCFEREVAKDVTTRGAIVEVSLDGANRPWHIAVTQLGLHSDDLERCLVHTMEVLALPEAIPQRSFTALVTWTGGPL